MLTLIDVAIAKYKTAPQPVVTQPLGHFSDFELSSGLGDTKANANTEWMDMGRICFFGSWWLASAPDVRRHSQNRVKALFYI